MTKIQALKQKELFTTRVSVACLGTLMRIRRALIRSSVRRESVPHASRARLTSAPVLQLLRKYIPSRRPAWVQVQSGYSRGLWIQIDLLRERSWWAGSHEPVVQTVLEDFICENTVFYDVGAHLGFFTLAAARVATKVIALEPDPDNAARLRAHVSRNNLDNKIDTIEAALWSTSIPSIAFRTGVPHSQGGVEHGTQAPVIATGPLTQVRAIKLDDLVSDTGMSPHVIKIDVEGAAAEVLNGGIETIRACRPALIVEIHTSAECDDALRFLDMFSYTTYWDVPPEGFPRHCFAFDCRTVPCNDAHTPLGCLADLRTRLIATARP